MSKEYEISGQFIADIVSKIPRDKLDALMVDIKLVIEEAYKRTELEDADEYVLDSITWIDDGLNNIVWKK